MENSAEAALRPQPQLQLADPACVTGPKFQVSLMAVCNQNSVLLRGGGGLLSERSFPNGSCAPLLCPAWVFTSQCSCNQLTRRWEQCPETRLVSVLVFPPVGFAVTALPTVKWGWHREMSELSPSGRLPPSFVGKIRPRSVPPSGNWEWAFILRLSAALIRLSSVCCWRWVRNTLPWATVITRAL